jgi:hypothetical protein
MRFHLLYFPLNHTDELQHNKVHTHFLKPQKQNNSGMPVKSGSKMITEIY